MIYTYYASKAKWICLRIIGFIFHPWTSDMGVRVIQHYPSYGAFAQIYPEAIKANQQGLKYIVVKTAPDPVATNIPSKVVDMRNFKRKPKRTPKK